MNFLPRSQHKLFVVLIVFLGSAAVSTQANADNKRVTNNNPTRQLQVFASAADVNSPSNVSVSPYIIGGVDAKSGDYPWMVALLDANEPEDYMAQYCGGTLVAPDLVITAAHCLSMLSDASALKVIVPAYDISGTTVNSRISVRGFIIHPDYNPSSNDSDIGIIKLAEKLNVPTLPIFDPQSSGVLVDGDMLKVIGFGALNNPATALHTLFPRILQEAQLPFINRETCSSVMNSTLANKGIGAVITIPETQICAGDGNYDRQNVVTACNGDSGGPLMFDITGAGDWRLVGIVSWGLGGCGLSGTYGVYTEASDFQQWIADVGNTIHFENNVVFGIVTLDAPVTEQVTKQVIVDSWSDSPISISSVSLSDPNQGFNIVSNNCDGKTLTGTQSCVIEITFAPSVAAALSTQLQLTLNNGTSISGELLGEGYDIVNATSALDTELLTWYSGPDSVWHAVAHKGSFNGNAMQSGFIGDFQSTGLMTFVEGEGIIQFNYKMDSGPGDMLYLYIDDRKTFTASGIPFWSSPVFLITTPGKHRLLWVFEKTNQSSQAQASVLIDRVAWLPPGSTPNPNPIPDQEPDSVVSMKDKFSSGDGGGGSFDVCLLLLITLRLGMRERTQ